MKIRRRREIGRKKEDWINTQRNKEQKISKTVKFIEKKKTRRRVRRNG